MPGPVVIISGYINFGPVWTFSVVTAGMLLPMILLFILRDRYIKATDNKAEENLNEAMPMTGIDSD